MNQKQIGALVIIIGILLAGVIFLFKVREEKYIAAFTLATGSCYLEDGTCLHEGTFYVLGWVIACMLIILGIYLVYFDKTQQVLAEHQQKVSSALKEAKEKDEFTAYLSGFTDDEQKIIKAINEQEGIQQSTLRFRLNMSKTGLSLLLTSLETRGVVSKKVEGKTNLLYLVRKF